MSDPVSNAEVEDVLSSIRRLVSEEKRPHHGENAAAQKAKAQSDKLVLTPSLRVATTRDESQLDAVEADAPEADAPEDITRGTSDLSIDSLVTDDEPLDVYGDAAAETPTEEITTDHLATDYSADPYGFDDPDNVDGTNDDEDKRLMDRGFGSETQEQSEQERQIEEAVFEELADEDAAADDDAEEQAHADLNAPLWEDDDAEPPTSQEDARVDRDTSTPDAPVRRGFLSQRLPEPEAMGDVSDAEPDSLSENTGTTEDKGTTKDIGSSDDAPASHPPMTDGTDGKAAALSAKIAALETAIGKISDTWEPDDAGESEYAGTAAPEVMAWEDDAVEPDPFARPTLAPVLRKLDDLDQPDSGDDAEVSGAEASFEADEPAAEEADETEATSFEQRFTSQRSGQSQHEDAALAAAPEETQASEDIVAPQDPEPEHPSMSEAMPEPEPQQTASEPDAPQASIPLGANLPDEEQLLDEEALRDLVSEIVRSELQGALGERITRNVRKLVRREIHRALTAQELE